MKKTPITYYGGKQKLLKVILPLIPQHNLSELGFILISVRSLGCNALAYSTDVSGSVIFSVNHWVRIYLFLRH
jgi:hypothetical protein